MGKRVRVGGGVAGWLGGSPSVSGAHVTQFCDSEDKTHSRSFFSTRPGRKCSFGAEVAKVLRFVQRTRLSVQAIVFLTVFSAQECGIRSRTLKVDLYLKQA